jgi:hypothetical protein
MALGPTLNDIALVDEDELLRKQLFADAPEESEVPGQQFAFSEFGISPAATAVAGKEGAIRSELARSAFVGEPTPTGVDALAKALGLSQEQQQAALSPTFVEAGRSFIDFEDRAAAGPPRRFRDELAVPSGTQAHALLTGQQNVFRALQALPESERNSLNLDDPEVVTGLRRMGMRAGGLRQVEKQVSAGANMNAFFKESGEVNKEGLLGNIIKGIALAGPGLMIGLASAGTAYPLLGAAAGGAVSGLTTGLSRGARGLDLAKSVGMGAGVGLAAGGLAKGIGSLGGTPQAEATGAAASGAGHTIDEFGNIVLVSGDKVVPIGNVSDTVFTPQAASRFGVSGSQAAILGGTSTAAGLSKFAASPTGKATVGIGKAGIGGVRTAQSEAAAIQRFKETPTGFGAVHEGLQSTEQQLRSGQARLLDMRRAAMLDDFEDLSLNGLAAAQRGAL